MDDQHQRVDANRRISVKSLTASPTELDEGGQVDRVRRDGANSALTIGLGVSSPRPRHRSGGGAAVSTIMDLAGGRSSFPGDLAAVMMSVSPCGTNGFSTRRDRPLRILAPRHSTAGAATAAPRPVTKNLRRFIRCLKQSVHSSVCKVHPAFHDRRSGWLGLAWQRGLSMVAATHLASAGRFHLCGFAPSPTGYLKVGNRLFSLFRQPAFILLEAGCAARAG